MSEALAIPATTLVLRLIIERRLRAAYGALPLPAQPVITDAPPPRSSPAAGQQAPPEAPALLLYLHHVSPNSAWRNMHDPRMGSDGQRRARAPLALDLHYLLAAQGAGPEREVLLGIGVAALTRNALIPRPMITQLLGGIAIPANPTSIVETVPGAGLDADPPQYEQISISQTAFDLDQSTKLWSALQSPLRPSALFTVTTVFLDSGEAYPAGPDTTRVNIGTWPSTTPADRSRLPADATASIEAAP